MDYVDDEYCVWRFGTCVYSGYTCNCEECNEEESHTVEPDELFQTCDCCYDDIPRDDDFETSDPDEPQCGDEGCCEKEVWQFMYADGFDDCIVGFDYVNERVIYDKDKMIGQLMNNDDMDYSDAEDYYYFNIEGAYVGEHTPIFMSRNDPREE